MKKILISILVTIVLVGSLYFTYKFGWYEGIFYNGIASQISMAGHGVALRSYMRQGKKDEAMEFIEKTMIEGNLKILELQEQKIPGDFREAYEKVKKSSEK